MNTSPQSHVHACMLSRFSHVQLFATLWTIPPPGSTVHGILQARILEWGAMPSPRDLPHPGFKPKSLMSPSLAGELFTISAT